MLRAARVALV